MLKRIFPVLLAMFALTGVAAVTCGFEITNPPPVVTLQGYPSCATSPSTNQVLAFGGTNWCGSARLSLGKTLAGGDYGAFGDISAQPTTAGNAAYSASLAADADFRFEVIPGTGVQVGDGTVAPTTVIDETASWVGTTVATAHGGTGNTVGSVSFMYCASVGPAAAATDFAGCAGQTAAAVTTTENITTTPVDSTCTVLKLTVQQNINANTNVPVFTVDKNTVATALTCTIANGTRTCHDNTHNFTVVQGDLLDVKMANPASGAVSNEVMATIELECAP
jgi:hypothetical protein